MVAGSAGSSADPGVPTVSVVIPVHNGARRLPGLLEALRAQTVPQDRFEVIFVDDCSSDETTDLIESANARLVSAPSRGGSYAARNLALPHVRAPLVAFTDSDCLPAPDWIERGLEEMDRTGADLLVGRVDLRVRAKPTIAALIDATQFLDQRRYSQQGFGATANLWVRREVFERHGIFEGRIVAGADKEFGQRATSAGADLVYAADVVVTHPARERPRELVRKALRVGLGGAQQIRYAEGELRDQGRIWLRPNAYVPRGRFRNLERLELQGIHPSRAQRIAMFWLQYFAMKLPVAAGNFAGDVAEAWKRLRKRAG